MDRRQELGNKCLDKSKNQLVEPSRNDGESVKGVRVDGNGREGNKAIKKGQLGGQ